MKTSAVVLAVLLAATGAASAGDGAAKQKISHVPQGAAQEKPVLDNRPTGSIKRVAAEPTLDHASDKALAGSGKRLGMDVSPWMMPFAH